MARIYIKRVIAISILLFHSIGLLACSFPSPKPKEGVWYCEELMIEIDFSVLNENESVNPPYFAKKYNVDGTHEDVLCLFDYGCIVEIRPLDWKDYGQEYLLGEFKYQRNAFSVTSNEDEHVYVFERIDD